MTTKPTPLEGEDEIRKAISSAFHRCRTRALRNAEVRLDHIAEAQADVIAFVKSYTATKEREARIDELDHIDGVDEMPICFQGPSYKTVKGRKAQLKAELTALNAKEKDV